MSKDYGKSHRDIFTLWICDFVQCNFKDTKNDAFVHGVPIDEHFIFMWDTIEEDLKREISKRTGLNFDIVFDKEQMQIRGRLIKIGGKRYE